MRRALAFVVLCLAASTAAAATPARLAVCVFYDGDDNAADYRVGERSAVMVRNLLGHFQEVDPTTKAVGAYAPGDLARCDRAVYIGTYFEGKMPDAFVADAGQYGKPFLWMQYNIWQLAQKLGPDRFHAQWGFDYVKVDETTQSRKGEIPRFYNEFTYKGARFAKVAQLDADGGFIGDPAVVLVKNQSATVLAEGTHSGTKQKTPYLLRKGDHFYIADNPLSVIDERDRYLILADVLFDFLQLAPRTQKRYALARLEDIHPAYDLKVLYQAIEVFRRRHIPFAMTVIPRYVGSDNPGLDATDNVKFVRMLRYAVDNGASILVHGYEHQIGIDLGCGISYSGEGYEFWDVCKNRPLPFDSPQFVQERLDKAKRILEEAKLPYAGWVTPHYAASETALRVIHRNFGRILQRMDYYLAGRPYSRNNTTDQFFPYTIWDDYYGLHIWPENLGYLPAPAGGAPTRSPEDIVELARLNKVVRDAWASFFWHPFLVNTPLGIGSLEKIVDGIRAEGYEFVSLQELRKRGE